LPSEISVERQFRFHCSCGNTTVSGERTVTCSGCGATLGIRRIRRFRQRSDSVAYYSSSLPVRRVETQRQHQNVQVAIPNLASPLGAWLKRALSNLAGVRQLDRQLQPANKAPRAVDRVPGAEPSVNLGDQVRVGPSTPSGSPHPHAGAVGRVMDIFEGHAYVMVESAEPQYHICVSLSCLDLLA